MEKKPPRFALFTLFWVVATELIGFGLIIPVLPQIAARYQPNPYLLGFLLASYSLCQFFSAPILGRLSDKYGRKPVLLVSKMGTCISYLIFAFSGTYWLILLSRMLDGFTGGNISVARAYVADVTTDEHRSRGMAVIGMAFGFGFLLGPAMGGGVISCRVWPPCRRSGSGIPFFSSMGTDCRVFERTRSSRQSRERVVLEGTARHVEQFCHRICVADSDRLYDSVFRI
ncbi:MAG: MFS transporter [Candidatus Margulisiibacteriota bacterium]